MEAASADGGGDPPHFLWIKVKGGRAREYETRGLRNVSNLLDKVKEIETPGLDHIRIGHLTLYQSEGGTALKPGALVSNIKGGKDDDNPLYVHFPDPAEEPAAKRPKVGSPSEQCLWLDSAVGKLRDVPEGHAFPWKADDAVEFDHHILGDRVMGKTLVARKCYGDLHDKIRSEWLYSGGDLREVGVCVVTGTPGIGKSVFMAYMAARLASAGCNIVLQRGRSWTSYKEGEGAANHREEPVTLLEDASFVLLADPRGGENRRAVDCRNAGCTIVFTSPHKKNYDTALKQAGPNQARYFLALWSEDELVKHRGVVLVGKNAAWVKQAHGWLGGSLRRLQQLSAAPGDSEAAAKQMIQTSIGSTTYSELITACRSDPATLEDSVPNSTLSAVLQLHTNDYKVVEVKLLDSELALVAIREKLQLDRHDAAAAFIVAALDQPALGTLFGRIFQSHVIDVLTGKNSRCRTLSCQPLPRVLGVEAESMEVPNTKTDVQTVLAGAPRMPLMMDYLYVPLSETFPAADFFFVVPAEGGKLTMKLLQTTKNVTHDCKIGSMIVQLKKRFNNVEVIDAWHWLVVAPESVASKYEAAQKVVDEPGGTVVKQFVAAWPPVP